MCKILWKVTSVCFRICLERNKNCWWRVWVTSQRRLPKTLDG
jgi:hypothetical protein